MESLTQTLSAIWLTNAFLDLTLNKFYVNNKIDDSCINFASGNKMS